MAKKEEISIFGGAKTKAPTGAKKDDKEVVVVKGLEEKLLEFEFIKAQIKDLTAQEKNLNSEIKDIAKEKFVELYQSKRSNPNTFYIKDGEGCVMILPSDAYIKIGSEARANELIEAYGDDAVTVDEQFVFNNSVLQRNMKAIEKAIRDAKGVSDDDKRDLIDRVVEYKVAKGFIDRLYEYGDNMETVMNDIQPIISLKICGGSMEHGGELHGEFMGNIYGGGERMADEITMSEYRKGGRVYDEGLSYKLDRAKHNKSEDWEVPMNKRKFVNGGTLDALGKLKNGGEVRMYEILDEVEDYSEINKNDIPKILAQESFEKGLDDDEIQTKINKHLIKLGYNYDSNEYKWKNANYAKGGRVKNYKYVPNHMIESVDVERNGKTTEIDGANILDGIYVKGKVKFADGGMADGGEVKRMKEMMDSCYTYGGLDKGSYNYERYILPYKGRLGEKMFDKVYNQYSDLLKSDYEVEGNTYTDSEGLTYNTLKKKYANGGMMDYGSDLTDESTVRENITNGEIHCDTLTEIIGCEPNYPCHNVGSLKLTKCFLRPYYKIG